MADKKHYNNLIVAAAKENPALFQQSSEHILKSKMRTFLATKTQEYASKMFQEKK